jgi:tRNA pseudouridine38-40 synthase
LSDNATVPTRHVAFTVEYDGSRFFGFQYQQTHPTVQGELLRVFKSLLRDRFVMRAAGRTDRGVHALGQVISIRSDAPFRWDRITDLANDRLGSYIHLRDMRDKHYDFHPRFEARLRHYRYCVCEDPARKSPMLNGYVTFTDRPLDWGAVEAAAAQLIGEKNFRSFCTRPIDQPRLVRSMNRIEFHRSGSFVMVDFYGRSFLRGMIRNIMGWLFAIGRGNYPPSVVEYLLSKPIKDESVRPAPPEGLYLVEIWYPGDEMPSWYTPIGGAPVETSEDEE